MAKMRPWKIWASALVLTGLLLSAAVSADVPMITKEELKPMLNDPNVIIMDIRLDKHLKTSNRKIKGAVQESIATIKTWAPKYPKDKTLVLYCA